MLDDRDNMRRRPKYESPWSVATLIIGINVAVFIVQNLLEYRAALPIYDFFALSLNGLKHGYLWQLITFQFLHLQVNQGGIFHLAGNLFLIRLFGEPLETRIGHARFAELYLLSGTLGGLLSPEHFGHAIVGASAGVFGLMAAFATLFPGKRLHFFFLPFSIRADALMAGAVTVTLICLFLPGSHVAHCAHLGGIFCGYIFARKANRMAGSIPPVRVEKGLLKIGTVEE